MNLEEVSIERLIEYDQADAADIGKLMPLLSESFSDEPINEDLLRSIIESPYHDQLIARLHGRIVGAASLSIIMGVGAGRKGHLEDFVTDTSVRQQGVGDKIWNEMIRWCAEHSIDLEFTSRPSRTRAHEFYHQHGATVRDTTVFHVEVER